ncbi:hypothetical protein Q8A67_024209 [Cirrhinus molitorella]|uniref:Uncharacterized protein n=1 Tax=Cirrhinus molitorella TaxID=172907 RepID=A0AA88P3Z8_9TELE|nr:hypothetical protein Q8A67_024209 [Cirrhinus molitorella]
MLCVLLPSNGRRCAFSPVPQALQQDSCCTSEVVIEMTWRRLASALTQGCHVQRGAVAGFACPHPVMANRGEGDTCGGRNSPRSYLSHAFISLSFCLRDTLTRLYNQLSGTKRLSDPRSRRRSRVSFRH